MAVFCLTVPALAQAENCPGPGSCLNAHLVPGCENEACCTTVCLNEPSCCAVTWDESCVALANNLCTFPPIGCPGTGSCFNATLSPGCENELCCELVCALRPSCCNFTWNEACAILAGAICAPPPSGACCVPDIGCVSLTENECGEVGGEWTGLATCTEDTCPKAPPSGACCVADACFTITENACAQVGGQWLGTGVTCANSNACSPVGACCLDLPSCEQITEAVCLDQNGTFLGPNTQCYEGMCDQTLVRGACCLGEECTQLFQLSCGILGGTWLGAESSCDADPCDLCPADTNNDGQVDTQDFLNVIGQWGPCLMP